MKKWAFGELHQAATTMTSTTPLLLCCPLKTKEIEIANFNGHRPIFVRGYIVRYRTYVVRIVVSAQKAAARSKSRTTRTQQQQEEAEKRPHNHSHHGMELGLRGAAPSSNDTAPTPPSPLLNIRKLNPIVQQDKEWCGERPWGAHRPRRMFCEMRQGGGQTCRVLKLAYKDHANLPMCSEWNGLAVYW